MKSEGPLARAERITAELRAATAEAAGVLKDLTHAVRQARATVEEYCATEVQRALDENTRHVQSLVDSWNEEARTHINGVIDRSVAKANAQIDAATSIGMLAEAVAEAVARNTRFINGEPHIVYGAEHGLIPPHST